MLPEQSSILSRALQSLDSVAVDYYSYQRTKSQRHNYEALGRMLIAKRALAEILGLNLNNFKLPGEDDSDATNAQDMYSFTRPSTSSALTTEERRFIYTEILQTLAGVSGVQDADDSCLRCARRMLAEVIGYETLAHYPVLFCGDQSKPKYYLAYEPCPI